MAAIVITFEKRIGALERLLLAPLEIRTILFGKTLGSTIFGLVITLVITIFLIPMIGVTVKHLFSFLLIIILSGVTFSLLGILISVGVKEVFEAMDYVQLLSVSHDFSLRGLLPGFCDALPSPHHLFSSVPDLSSRWVETFCIGRQRNDSPVSQSVNPPGVRFFAFGSLTIHLQEKNPSGILIPHPCPLRRREDYAEGGERG